MTQRNQSGDRRLHNLLQRCLTTKHLASSLPAQSLCWLSSFSLLSSGFVYAQVDTSIDNIVPTVENSRQIPVTNPVEKEVVRSRSATAVESTQGTPDFSERRARLKKRLRSKTEVSQSSPVRRSTSQSKPDEAVARIRRSRPSVEISEPDTTARRFRPQVEASRVKPVRIRQEKPQETTFSNYRTIPDRPLEVSPPPSNPDRISGAEGKKDYNNAYIDPNDYKKDGTSNYQAPNSVVLTERSSGCRTILAPGANAGICAKIPITPYGDQRVADSNNQRTRSSAPSWIRRSQNLAIANVSPSRRLASGENNTGWRRTRVGPINLNNGGWREKPLASATVSKSGFRPNRFIPNPSSFNPNPIVGSRVAPPAGSLSAPMTADNTAPRDSTVAYDIPLASALPQIPYTGAVAANPGGMVFPLSVPSPITSLFGWRVHPITGNRRFHAGTDLGAAMGTPILAAATGQVEVADYLGGYGLTVIMNHSSAQQTLYGHMSEVLVQPGQVVQQGTVIGRVGSTGNSTGPHLHFEVRHLTSQGWVATNPGVQLDSALSQLIQATRTARVIGQPGS